MANHKYEVVSGRVGRNKQTYVPGDVFIAPEGEMKGKRDLLMDHGPVEEVNEQPLQAYVKHRGFGNYDVIHGETGETINDKKLTKKEAEDMIHGR